MLAVILICALGQDHAMCQRPTARSVITHATEATLPYACLKEAQEYAAMNSITNRLKPGEYLKIGCEPGNGQPTDDHL